MAFAALGWKTLRAAGLTPDEIEQLTREVQAELLDPANRIYFVFYVIYGRKPLTS
jgi:hypothetical protein